MPGKSEILRRLARNALLLAPMAAIAACGGQPVPADVGVRGSDRIFGPVERKAAVALSIGRPTLLQNAGTAYDQALVCKVALDQLAPTLRANTTGEQAAQLDLILARFAERANIEGSAVGKSRAQVARDAAAKAAATDDPAEHLPIAMACLRSVA